MTLYNDGQKLDNELIFSTSREFAGQKESLKYKGPRRKKYGRGPQWWKGRNYYFKLTVFLILVSRRPHWNISW